ncbi:MAG: vWA domain-containing protein [Tepidisphaeraceae bacterium]|jgi:hypothetical protein
MLAAAPVSFSSFGLFAAAASLVIAAAAIAWYRRTALPRTAAGLALVGLLCLATATGRPMWHWPAEKFLVVLVDLSASTRGAGFRDSTALSRRLSDLLGDLPYQLLGFSDGRATALSARLAEMPGDRTRLPPISADAVVLFSDCQFELPPWMPPTYIVVDPNLEAAADASVEQLELRDHTLVATIRNTGGQRLAFFEGVEGSTSSPVTGGRTILTRPLKEAISSPSVQLTPGDLWPENDAMSIRQSPPFASEAWWVGRRSAPPGNLLEGTAWRGMLPPQLPHDPYRYLSPAVIVLDNVAATDIRDSAADQLVQYVRDLGGSLLILGGDSAFAAGGYVGTPLQTLSPLSSVPPQPTTRWILLLDASGSMSASSVGMTRWQDACSAAVRLLPLLPPQDPVQIGQFSDVLRWWTSGQSAAETAKLPLPPPDAVPFGPTDLEAALDRIAAESDATMPTHLLVLSDCDARIENPKPLAEIMQHKKIKLHVLAVSRGSGLDVIGEIAAATGGTLLQQSDPHQWFESIRKLSQAAFGDELVPSPVTVQFVNKARSLPGSSASPWNRTWMQQDARPLAMSTNQDPPLAMAAQWRLGRGTVTAVAFAPTLDQAQGLAQLIALQPRDSRFAVTWLTQRNLSVTVDAIDNGSILNNLKFSLQISGAQPEQTLDLPQVAPGRYALSLEAPRQAAVATLRGGGRIVDRIAVPARYSAEFDEVGNNHETMRQLAARTSGAVIWPGDHRRIDFHWPPRDLPLRSYLAGIGAALIAAALVRWRAE